MLREAPEASGSAPEQAAPRPRPLLAKKDLHPILVKGQLRRYGTPILDSSGAGGTEGSLPFQAQASWEHIDLTPPAR